MRILINITLQIYVKVIQSFKRVIFDVFKALCTFAIELVTNLTKLMVREIIFIVDLTSKALKLVPFLI